MQKLEEEIRVAQNNVSAKMTSICMNVAGFLFIFGLVYFDQPLLLKLFASLYSGVLLASSCIELGAVWACEEKTLLPKKTQLEKLRLVALIREEALSVVKAEGSIKCEVN